MKTAYQFALVSALLFSSLPAVPQTRSGFPTPPPPMSPLPGKQQPPKTRVQRIDALQLQREARELSDLASTLPADIDQFSHGLLPKDLSEKLKRIEKLSKQIRGEISR